MLRHGVPVVPLGTLHHVERHPELVGDPPKPLAVGIALVPLDHEVGRGELPPGRFADEGRAPEHPHVATQIGAIPLLLDRFCTLGRQLRIEADLRAIGLAREIRVLADAQRHDAVAGAAHEDSNPALLGGHGITKLLRPILLGLLPALEWSGWVCHAVPPFCVVDFTSIASQALPTALSAVSWLAHAM